MYFLGYLLLPVLLFAIYLVYQRFFHPLAKYPGPVLPSLTNLWTAWLTHQGVLHEELCRLHERYGPVVRIGPNHLHFWDPAAIDGIYKVGRTLPKTEAYDAFTTFKPNLFGTTDENIHALRRRQLAHGFSQVSIRGMEDIIDAQFTILRDILDVHAKSGDAFDLKKTISNFVFDILGEAAFSQTFHAQVYGADSIISAINNHLFLGCTAAQLHHPSFWISLFKWLPIPWMRNLVNSRAQVKNKCTECVTARMEKPSERKDLLYHLIHAKDPETGARLEKIDIETEAFAMLVAGAHTTSGTLTLLLYHLLQNPDSMKQLSEELDAKLSPLPPTKSAYSIDGLEASLPFTMTCIRENFRMAPVFSLPLWREVARPEGASIGNYHVPHGANVCIVNYALHHNPSIWGSDHLRFDPNRWLDGRANEYARFLLPFSIGHRMCIGKNLAMTNIIKATATLCKEYEVERVNKDEELYFRAPGIGELEGKLICKVSKRTGRMM